MFRIMYTTDDANFSVEADDAHDFKRAMDLVNEHTNKVESGPAQPINIEFASRPTPDLSNNAFVQRAIDRNRDINANTQQGINAAKLRDYQEQEAEAKRAREQAFVQRAIKREAKPTQEQIIARQAELSRQYLSERISGHAAGAPTYACSTPGQCAAPIPGGAINNWAWTGPSITIGSGQGKTANLRNNFGWALDWFSKIADVWDSKHPGQKTEYGAKAFVAEHVVKLIEEQETLNRSALYHQNHDRINKTIIYPMRDKIDELHNKIDELRTTRPTVDSLEQGFIDRDRDQAVASLDRVRAEKDQLLVQLNTASESVKFYREAHAKAEATIKEQKSALYANKHTLADKNRRINELQKANKDLRTENQRIRSTFETIMPGYTL